MNTFEQKYKKYKKKYLILKTIIQNGGGIGDIRDMSDGGPLTLVKDDNNGKYHIRQGEQVADIVNFEQICKDPKTYIFITKSGSVYKYRGEINEGRITKASHK